MATTKLGDYQFVEPIPDKFKCWHCKKLLEEPHVTECCGQHFCKKCIEESSQSKESVQHPNQPHQVPRGYGGLFRSTTLKTPNTTAQFCSEMKIVQQCPSCKKTDFKHIRYLPLKRKINDLIVYCPHKAEGCNEQLKLENIEGHVSKCNYKPIWCTKNCGQALLKMHLQDHLTKSCPQRIIVCQHCKGSHQYAQTQNHQLQCPDYPLPCPNRCGQLRIKRREINNHKSICPLENVKCSFAEVGCTHCCQRKSLQVHIKENVEAHLSLMMEAHLKLKQEVQRRF